MIYGFGERLVRLRKRNNLSQELLSRKIAVKKVTISSYERDSAYPTLKNFYKICLTLEANSDYLLGLDKNDYLLLDGLNNEQKNLIRELVRNFKRKRK